MSDKKRKNKVEILDEDNMLHVALSVLFKFCDKHKASMSDLVHFDLRVIGLEGTVTVALGDSKMSAMEKSVEVIDAASGERMTSCDIVPDRPPEEKRRILHTKIRDDVCDILEKEKVPYLCWVTIESDREGGWDVYLHPQSKDRISLYEQVELMGLFEDFTDSLPERMDVYVRILDQGETQTQADNHKTSYSIYVPSPDLGHSDS